MTVTEIMEQARVLTLQERKELVKLLVDTLDFPQDSTTVKQDVHWGQSLNRLLDEMDPIEMKYPEIEDPVDWLKHLRSDHTNKTNG